MENSNFSLFVESTDTVGALSGLDNSNDRRRKALESIIFSRRFIVTYNIVLCILLFGFAGWHWGSKLVPRRQRRKYGLSTPTIHHKLIPKNDPPGEATPLLKQKSYGGSPRRIKSVASRLRSWMIYQPPNIPYVNKILPSNATIVGILFLFAFNLFYLFYNVQLSLATAFIFADRAGLLFVANLPFLYILAAKNQPLKLLIGSSYEGLNIIHRRLGEWMCLLALLHAGSMFLVYYTTLASRISLSRFLALPIIWLGLLAFLSYETLYLTSLGSFRQRFYELFLGLHVFLQASALGFLWFHHPNSRPYVLIALTIFVVDRLVFRMFVKTGTVKADLSVMDDGETVMLSSNWQLRPRPRWMLSRLNIKSGWKPAEHVFLTVPALSNKHAIQAHPFTIASAAPGSSDSHAWLNFLIRARDGFSRDLLHYARSHSFTNIRVDGPYGASHALDMLHDNEVSVVVAGGSGIAVAFPLVWSLMLASSQDTESGYDASSRRRVSLIWVVHQPEHVEWIPRDRLEELRDLGCQILIPPPTSKAGRPDLPQLLEGAVSAWNHEIDDPSVGVVISGPDEMNRICRNACADLVRRGANLNVSVEKFGW